MITNNFLNHVDNVLQEAEYRHLDEGFEAVVDAANENYQEGDNNFESYP